MQGKPGFIRTEFENTAKATAAEAWERSDSPYAGLYRDWGLHRALGRMAR